MGCFLDEFGDMLFYRLSEETAAQIAARFNRERKTVYNWINGGGIRLNIDFLSGLWSMGYDLELKLTAQAKPTEKSTEKSRRAFRYTDALLSGEIPPANAQDKIALIIRDAQAREGAEKTAQRFGRERKVVYSWMAGCPIHIDRKFIAGLCSLGYELHLGKRKAPYPTADQSTWI